MRTYLKRDSAEKSNTVQRRERKEKCTSPQKKDFYWASGEVIQRQLYYNVKGQKGNIAVSNLDQFNNCMHAYYILLERDLEETDFSEAERPLLNDAIKSINDDELMVIGDAESAIKLIQRKISAVMVGNQAAAAAAAAAESERIDALAEQLKKKWQGSRAKIGGIYIGNPEAWHIHTAISTQEHLKFGNDIGTRSATNSYDAIVIAVRKLEARNGLTLASGIMCYSWLRHMAIFRHGKDLPPDLRHDDI